MYPSYLKPFASTMSGNYCDTCLGVRGVKTVVALKTKHCKNCGKRLTKKATEKIEKSGMRGSGYCDTCFKKHFGHSAYMRIIRGLKK
jgi:hypothetical protein